MKKGFFRILTLLVDGFSAFIIIYYCNALYLEKYIELFHP